MICVGGVCNTDSGVIAGLRIAERPRGVTVFTIRSRYNSVYVYITVYT